MVSPSFGVGDTEPSRATRRDEGSVRRDDLLPQTGLRDPSPLADQNGDPIRQMASLGLRRVRSRRTEELPWTRADRLAQAVAFRESFSAPGSTRWSSPRPLIPNFTKTFPRWYSTVRGLTKRRAPISGFDKPSRAIAAIRIS